MSYYSNGPLQSARAVRATGRKLRQRAKQGDLAPRLRRAVGDAARLCDRPPFVLARPSLQRDLLDLVKVLESA